MRLGYDVPDASFSISDAIHKGQVIHLIYENVELFNVAEAVAVPGRAGVLLQRIPESVQSRLRDASQRQYRQATGVELRFVNEGGPAQITLASYGGSVQAYLYFGKFCRWQLYGYRGADRDRVRFAVAAFFVPE